ncbi:Ig-like domain-containing protein [Flavobacterium hercynium]|uniref:Gliding motility-associated C-terminal domain-containing protein n=1 Tax=Flavobacterium hercynium TaxID=387094 RepID=A0A226HBY1_9FLAO|nr:gliding motility-associated C-terminal domain-containing protein [Flavobacterium hercynium]OXA91151.1 hypothetical protein B0A66_11245 [Flavobacterium hercynium]SMP11351.1 gliding motility-associated C-terminal domain-containing protein [Flavobacterium hercynium]
MKKIFTFSNLNFKERLFGLLFLMFLSGTSFAQTVCRPSSQTNSQGGLLCVGLNVDSPGNAFDTGGLTTFATLTNAVGVGCFVEETLTLGQTARAGDQIVIYFGTGNSVLDVGLLSNATIQPKLSSVNSGTSLALNSPLLNLNLLSGNNIAEARYTLTGDTNQVQIQVGGLLSLLVSLRIYDVRLEFAQPTVTGGLNQTICAGTSTTLVATPSAGTTLAWYSSPTATTALQIGNSYPTPILTANTTYYIGVSRGGTCESNSRVPVVVNVANPVAPSLSTTGTAICSTGATQQTTLSVSNPVAGTTYNWYSVASGGVSLASGTTYSPTVSVGTTPFFVEAVIGGCVSPARTGISVVSVAVPALPTLLTQSATIQAGQNATLSAAASPPSSGATLNWYDVPTGGTALATNSPTFTTPILNATKTFYVEAQSTTGNCVSATRVPVVVTVLPSPLGGCLEANSQQTAQNGLCLLCSTTTPNNSVDGNPTTAARLTVPAGLLNAGIVQTLQFSNPGKAGDIVDVDLGLPGGIADVVLLGGVSLATYNGATFNNDRVLITNPLVTLQVLSGDRFRASIVAGANFDRVEIRFGGLATLLSNLDIYQATYRYKAPTITGNTTICAGTAATVVASLGAGETVGWYAAPAGGTAIVSTASFTTPNLNAATTYYVQITRNGCVNSERTPVLINVTSPVTPVISPASATICSGQGTVFAVQAPVTGTVYNWYDAATGGNLVFTGTSFSAPALTANTTYYVEASIGSCINATRTPVSITVNPLPATATPVSSNVIIQSGQTVALQVSNSVPDVTYDWFDVPTGGTAIATNTATYTPNPALMQSKTYYVQARNTITNCVSGTRAVIDVTVITTVNGCLQPNFQATSLNPVVICVGCTSTNQNGSVDNDINTFANLSMPVGVGSYIQQRLTFPTPGQAGDIIDVELEVPVGTLDISLVSNITLATYSGGVYNNDRTAVNNNVLNVQLLSGNRFKVSFTAAASFNELEIRLSGLATVVASVNIYGASYRFPNAVITGNATPICAGGSATLGATASGTETFTWYTVPTGGTPVSVTPTAQLNATTTFYLQATRGTCVNTIRQAVTVNVLPVPTAANIIIASPVEATCTGGAVLTPTSTIAGATFRYYTSQTKAQEITTGTIGGVTYVKDATTGALTISGLTLSSAPFSYFISATNGGICETAAQALKEVVINAPALTPLTVIPTPLAGCGTVDLRNAISPLDTTGNTTYTFYDSLNNVIPPAAAGNINTSGVYFIQAQGNGVTCPSARLQVTVNVNPLPSLTVPPSISVNVGTSVPLTATSNGTVTWYDPAGNQVVGSTGALNTPGVYTYTAVATNASCSITATFSINVISVTACQLLTERVYATTQTSGSLLTGTVTNGGNAVDGNTRTYSTITTGIGLLGIGSAWQNLQWPTTIPKGTPVKVKLGSEYSAVAVGQNLSVIGTKRDGLGNPVDIGVLQSVSGSLLNLLSGENAYEFTFVPSNTGGPQDYDGIRIQSAAIVGVLQNTRVYDAHYSIQVPTIACTPGDIQDIYHGATDLGLPIGAVTATVGVTDPYNVSDNDIATFATMYSGINALAAADLTVVFKTPSIATDSIKIVISKPAVLLDVTALTGLSIQRYLGNVPVGAPILNTDSLLSIRLLPGNTMATVLIESQPEPFDRIRIRLGGAVGVLDFLRVHTVERVANTKVIDSDINNNITVCPGSSVILEVPAESCSTYVWYDAPTGGNVVANGGTFNIPATLAPGTYKYYIQPVRYDCEVYARGEVTVTIDDLSPATTLTDITLNGGSDTSICSPTGAVTLATSLSGNPALTNPIYYWYVFDGTTDQLVAGQTNSQLPLTGLAPGTYTYSVGVSGTEFCQTAEADRKKITFTILKASIASDITVNDVAVCHDVPATLTPTASVTFTNPVFTWYFDAAKTQPIVNGAVVGTVTYNISATGALTVTGLTRAMSPSTYYVAVASDVSCENLAGTLEPATILINDPATPTTTDDTPDFCLIDAPTVSDIVVNETNVVWYIAATGGSPLAPTTALIDGTIYYGAFVDPLTGCESSGRLAVTVNINDALPPTTTDTTQEFCLENAPTLANIAVDQTGVIWYAAAQGGTPLAANTALVNGITYHGALVDPLTTCESSARLAVTVTINDPGTPSTTDITQDFCLANAPTVADIAVNETGVIWYAAPQGGAPLAANTALVNGTVYYGGFTDASTTCSSAVRLAVTANVTDPLPPTTTDTTQDFCITAAPTVANIAVDQTGVIWYTAAQGGTVIAPTTALVNGGIYFGALVNPITTCESLGRLRVDVTLLNASATPTTNENPQNFCLIDAPTVANIQANEANVVWYSAATGGTALPATTALVSGIYYGAISGAVPCENPLRLPVTVNVNTPDIINSPTAVQVFCASATPTIEDIVVSQPNVVWYTSATGGTPLPPNTPLTAGTYYATTDNNVSIGCTNAARLGVGIEFQNDALFPLVSTDDTPCVFQGISYSVANGKSDYVWSVTNGTITSGGGNADGTATISWSDVGPGRVEVTYLNNCDETTTKSLDLTVATCSDLTITNTVSNPKPSFGEIIVFTITVNNVGQGTILNTIVSELIPSGYDLVSFTTTVGVYDPVTQLWTIPTLNPGDSQILEVRLLVLPSGNYNNVATIEISTPLDVDAANNSATAFVEPVCFTVYNEFTPNNDGANDLFKIDCIEAYPNNELKVFNRYGSLVYSKKGYENDWNGTANVSGVLSRGDMLPTGTYFYVIDIGDGTIKKGWLSIMR